MRFAWLLLLLAASDIAMAAGDPGACARIGDDAARLACFDALFPRPGIVQSSPAPGREGTVTPPAAPNQASVDPRASFGDRGQLPAARAVRAEIPRRADFRVSKVGPLPGGLYQLTMEDGQVWKTREADWALEFKPGDAVTIQRMLMGGYRISLKGEGRNVGVIRIL